MGKGRKGGNKGNRNPNPKKRASHYEDAADDMMDDEIDAFHKQRDIVPLDINDDMEGSDEDDEHPVFDFKDASDEEEDSDDEDEDIEDDTQLTGLAAKIARQQKYLRAKVGGVEDEMHDDIEDKEEKRTVWGRRKDLYHGGDNFDYELQSSDEEQPAEEEAEVLRLQKEKAKALSMEDFGLEDFGQDGSDGEPTLEEILGKGKAASKSSADKEAHDEPAYEEVKKDLNALSKEEQMDVVYSSAPELVGLLSELSDALEELENKVNPLLKKVKEEGNTMKGGLHYLEVKQLLLVAYCQAITFYLLLKSEGQPVRDHPVIARLVEIKNLLDKVKELDVNLPSNLEGLLGKKVRTETVVKSIGVDVAMASDSFINSDMHTVGKQEATAVVPREAVQVVTVDSSKDDESKEKKRKHLNDQVGIQSKEMLKVRAALEEKLKQKGILASIAPKHDRVQKRLRPLNGQLQTLDDFDDDATDLGKGTPGMSKGHATSRSSSKLSQLVTPQLNKPKVVSGDDDLPTRDDIGERRRKHELRVLAGAGIMSGDDVDGGPGSDEDDDMEEEGVQSESDDDLYEQVKQLRAAKLAAKAEMYPRTSALQANPEETLVDGKRHITYQMEKNRGLTRARNKLIKNPRKKYKLKHQKAVVRRKGQVRDIKKPAGPYGGEASGINVSISRSIRFKN